jgi:hypothetical protein
MNCSLITKFFRIELLYMISPTSSHFVPVSTSCSIFFQIETYFSCLLCMPISLSITLNTSFINLAPFNLSNHHSFFSFSTQYFALNYSSFSHRTLCTYSLLFLFSLITSFVDDIYTVNSAFHTSILNYILLVPLRRKFKKR